jgi:chromatin remodeling complex protein RSC6
MTEETPQPKSHSQLLKELGFTYIDEQFGQVYTSLNSLVKKTKELQDNVRSLQKTCKIVERNTRAKKKRPQEVLLLNEILTNFLDLSSGSKTTKADVMKRISTYIKENNLQLEQDKRRFKPNKALCKLFVINPKTVMNLTFVEINKYISKHLTKIEQPVAAPQSSETVSEGN